jgi:hypothetical protein
MGGLFHFLHNIKNPLGRVVNNDRVLWIRIEAKLLNFVRDLFTGIKDELNAGYIEGKVAVGPGFSSAGLTNRSQCTVPWRNKYS